MTGTAVLSPCGGYRLYLTRRVQSVAPSRTVLFIGVNPSTAEATVDDPSVRKMVGFARRWGFGRMTLGNLFALRATDVRALRWAEDPVNPAEGYGNDEFLEVLLDDADLIIPCWGSRAKLPRTLHYRIGEVEALLRAAAAPVECLGRTASGDPAHPLMLAYSTPRQPYWP